MGLKDFINYGHSLMFACMFCFIKQVSVRDKDCYCILLLFICQVFINLTPDSFIDMEFLCYFYTIFGKKTYWKEPTFTCADFCVNQKEKSSMETELWHKWGYHHSYSGFVLSGTFMLISTQNFILLVVFFVPHLLLNIIRQSTVKN